MSEVVKEDGDLVGAFGFFGILLATSALLAAGIIWATESYNNTPAGRAEIAQRESITDEHGAIKGVRDFGNGVVYFHYEESYPDYWFERAYSAYLSAHPNLELVKMDRIQDSDGYLTSNYMVFFRERTQATS